ncbi:Rgg family transcriptional regulator [Streptococcus ictaluri]|uniref:DNA-binding helix-turn-helix protein n=1 Tax=Streptococcus ictaluri 707-05 TaxID=764299 RepID=G5JZD5_9STRE|nr:Rgg/GadR/MutR family transcriptional regulator [Streptococcus ictaluri]EHI70929.1 DNA-binding helix-turn-helix protein [Streptococcus ictaluri 707-05]
MNHFGEIFKTFRESRGLRLKDVARAGISTSQLSRFEKGETDLTISKFMLILDEINMPIDEFMYAVHDFRRDDLNELLSKVRHFVTNRDSDGLEHLLHAQLASTDKRETFHHINAILLKIRLQALSGQPYYTQQDLTDLTDYLFGVVYWGSYELLIFSNTLDVLSHDVFMVLAREMARRSDFYKEIPSNRRLISSMLLNGYITCVEREKFMDALYFEKQLKQCFFTETEVYERLVFQYVQSMYQYKKTNSTSAMTEMKKCIETMRLVGSHHLAKTYERYLETLLKNKN